MVANGKPRKSNAPQGWQPAFLAALIQTGRVLRALEAAGISKSAAYEQRQKDEAFRKAWDEALLESAAVLEEEARRRAIDGVQRLKFHEGLMITVPLMDEQGNFILDDKGERQYVPYIEHQYSDKLLIELLRANNPTKFNHRVQIQQSGGDVPPGAKGLYDLIREQALNSN
jgi:hypothetical protein